MNNKGNSGITKQPQQQQQDIELARLNIADYVAVAGRAQVSSNSNNDGGSGGDGAAIAITTVMQNENINNIKISNKNKESSNGIDEKKVNSEENENNKSDNNNNKNNEKKADGQNEEKKEEQEERQSDNNDSSSHLNEDQEGNEEENEQRNNDLDDDLDELDSTISKKKGGRCLPGVPCKKRKRRKKFKRESRLSNKTLMQQRSSFTSSAARRQTLMNEATGGEAFLADGAGDHETEHDKGILFPGYVSVAFKYFSQSSKPRYWCLRMITSPWFERVSMMVILVNCITLGMYQPCNDNPCTTNRCFVLQYLDHIIFIFFAVEMTVKIFAMGFIGKERYMAETWNRLDFFIVVAG
jgi:hypothetical protein